MQAGPSGMRIADLLDDINAQSSVRVSERDVRLALNELVSASQGSRCEEGREPWRCHAVGLKWAQHAGLSTWLPVQHASLVATGIAALGTA